MDGLEVTVRLADLREALRLQAGLAATLKSAQRVVFGSASFDKEKPQVHLICPVCQKNVQRGAKACTSCHAVVVYGHTQRDLGTALAVGVLFGALLGAIVGALADTRHFDLFIFAGGSVCSSFLAWATIRGRRGSVRFYHRALRR